MGYYKMKINTQIQDTKLKRYYMNFVNQDMSGYAFI